jgi:hypothetical protein
VASSSVIAETTTIHQRVWGSRRTCILFDQRSSKWPPRASLASIFRISRSRRLKLAVLMVKIVREIQEGRSRTVGAVDSILAKAATGYVGFSPFF